MDPPADTLSYLLDQARDRIIVFDRRQSVAYRNERAARFLARHSLPEEITVRLADFFGAIAEGKVAERFPGEFHVAREIGGRRWLFRVVLRREDPPLVCVYFHHESVSEKFELNATRQRYRLTRRETDALRHLLDGLSNLEIAEEMNVIEQTVKDHLSSVYAKLGVQDRFSLLRHLVVTERAREHPLPG